VVSDEPDAVVRIHLHADDPDAVLAHARTLGLVSGVKLDDMEAQRSRLLAGAEVPRELAMIAVVAGEGLRQLFASLYGVSTVLERHEAASPSLEALGAAVAGVPSERVLVLPNDDRLCSALEEASLGVGDRVLVVPTRNAPEGVAAALAFDPTRSAEDNVRAMTSAARGVRAVRVAYQSDGGRVVATYGDRPISDGTELLETAEHAIGALASRDAASPALVTIYHGAGTVPAEARDLAERLEQRFPGVETEIVAGGQPECSLWITLEPNAGPDRH
jgi:dihydroxyacetone kinase-like predicted kinase